jgi:RND family efflux transporter MFP subunit
MIIFRTFAIYLSIIGIILAIALIKMLNTPPPVAVHVLEPAANPYTNTIAASGIVEATDKNIFIGVPEEGIVTKLNVVVGDKVKKGEPLFEIDSRVLAAQLLYQEANVEVAKATLVRLQDQLERLNKVSDPRAISVDELKTRENDVNVAKAQLEASNATVTQTRQLIERLTVRAPKDGVIMQSNIREGEYVLKNTTTMILGDLEHLQVRADIDEQNAGWFNPASEAVAFPKNNTSISVPLKFVRVEPYVLPKVSLTGASEERVDTRVLQVIYSFDQPERYHVYVGQQVDIFIQKNPPKENSKEPADAQQQ